MALVSYSDSESDGESGPSLPPPPPASLKPKSSLALPPPKPSISTNASAPASSSTSSSSLALPPPKRRKLVSDTNATGGGPRKIIVDLPKTSTEDAEDNDNSSKSSLRKGGAGKGILSFLPAPKRTGDAAAKVAKQADYADANGKGDAGEGTEEVKKKRVLGGGAGRMEYAGTEMQPSVEDAEDEDYSNGAVSTSTTTRPTPTQAPTPAPAKAPPIAGMKPRTIQPFFRKSAKPKPSASASATAASVTTTTTTSSTATPTAKQTKKVSLFSMNSDDTSSRTTATSKSKEYEPIMVTLEQQSEEPDVMDYTSSSTAVQQVQAGSAGPQPDTLEAIGADLGLDENMMRMLQGRRGKNLPVKITEFNVDREYEANEAKRLAGELVPEHNPVRSIAPGKHQLTSLLSAAQSQKAALEESFAQGRKNKKEAGSKYGW